MKSLRVEGCQDISAFKPSKFCSLDYVMRKIRVKETVVENDVEPPDANRISA